MSEHWSERPEGGGHFALWLIFTIGLRLGRAPARALLYPITLYFFLRRGYERRVSRAFFARIQGRPASTWQVLCHIHRFASTMLDRVFLLAGRERDFDIRMQGLEALLGALGGGRGALLLGAHVGSFEVLRVAARARPDLELRVVLDVNKTPALTGLLHALDPGIAAHVIDAGRPGAEVALALAEALDRGAMVAILADRARRGERTLAVDFLGSPAPFPVAPFELGPLLGVPMVLCLDMYRGGRRYDVHFEPLAEARRLPRGEREAAVAGLVARYAARLDAYVREDPCNWFNWHDFWNPGEIRELGAGAGAGAGAGTAGVGSANAATE